MKFYSNTPFFPMHAMTPKGAVQQYIHYL